MAITTVELVSLRRTDGENNVTSRNLHRVFWLEHLSRLLWVNRTRLLG